MKKSHDEADISYRRQGNFDTQSCRNKFPSTGKSHSQLETENNENSTRDSSRAIGTPEDLKELPEESSSLVDKSDVAQTFAGLHKLHVAFKLETFPHENLADVDDVDIEENVQSEILQEDKLLSANNNTETNANHLNSVHPGDPPDEDSSPIKPVESEELPLVQSPLVTTPPYEYLVLPNGNESKFRIYLNQRVNENFHQAVLKQLTSPSNKTKDLPASLHPPRSIPSLANQQLPSGGSIASCFDPSEIDVELKQILLIHPPVTNTIVRKRPRKERGSSVPAIDSYYGCEDLEKVGHASYFIPLLTPSERKGWKDDYKYGKWKYSTPNLPKVTSGPIPLSSRHSTILKSTSSWWKRSLQQSKPIAPSATSVSASTKTASHLASHAFIVPFLKSTEDATEDEEDALLENASLASLAGSATEANLPTHKIPLSHFRRRIQLSKLFRWFIPDCLKTRTNKSSVQTWNEGDPSFQGSTRTSESSMMDGRRKQSHPQKLQVQTEESTTSGELNSVHLISNASHCSHKRKRKWGKNCGTCAKGVHRQPYRRLLLGCVGFSSSDEVEGGDIPDSTNGEAVQDIEDVCKEAVLEAEKETVDTNDAKNKQFHKTTTEASPVLELDRSLEAPTEAASSSGKRQCPNEDEDANEDAPVIKIPRTDSPEIPDSPASPDGSLTEPLHPNLNYGAPKVIPTDRVGHTEAEDDCSPALSDPASPSNVNWDSSESPNDDLDDNSNGPCIVLSTVLIVSSSVMNSFD